MECNRSNRTVNEVLANGNMKNGTRVKSVKPNADVSGSTADSPTFAGNKAKVISGGRRAFGENGFEEQGGYMAAKKAKLDKQFNTSTRVITSKDEAASNQSEIFKGLSVYINGYTDPPEPVLRELFILHGGSFHPYNSSKTTYVIATNLSAPSKRLHSSKTLKPEWIMESIEAGKTLDSRNYMLYNLNEEKNQMTLTQVMKSRKRSKKTSCADDDPTSTSTISKPHQTETTIESNPEKRHLESKTEEEDENSRDHVSESDEEEFFECSQEPLQPVAVPKINGSDNSTEVQTPTNGGIDAESWYEGSQNENDENETNGHECANDNDIVRVSTSPPVESDSSSESLLTTTTVQAQQSPPKVASITTKSDESPTGSKNSSRVKVATDEGFLEDFFSRSRLHLISEQKKEMQMFIANMRKIKDVVVTFPGLQKFAAEIAAKESFNNSFPFEKDEVILFHVDLDCFFASVGLLSRPHLRGKPIVVTHSSSKTQDSHSDIACASYEARKKGVKNGMWVGQAKSLCPELEVIPYDFEEYRRISKLFYETIVTVTLDVEAGSVDEMLVDVSSILRSVPSATPEELAEFFREIIFEATKCPASIGIGSNRLLAKLAVKLAKPNGVHFLKDCDALNCIQKLPVRDLPGVGWSNEKTLVEKFKVQTCGDLLSIPISDLKAEFGDKTAEKMLSLCRGFDSNEIKFDQERPKSVSVDVNFGIRFTQDSEVTNFLAKICKELETRAERLQALSKHFTLKLLIRKKGAGVPLKLGGHGLVNSTTRSRSLLTPTRNWQELYKTACSLVRAMRFPPSDYRGVGVTLSDLSFDCDKGNKKSVQRTLTDMPLSRAHKMLSLSQRRNKNLDSRSPSTVENNDGKTFQQTEPALEEDNNSELLSDNNSTNINRNLADTNQAATSSKSNSNQSDPSKLPVDIAVLRQLPREIAEEQCQFYGIDTDILDKAPVPAAKPNGSVEPIPGTAPKSRDATNASTMGNYYDNVETVDQSFLQALPDNIRQDILIQLQEAKGRRHNGSSAELEIIEEPQPCTSKQAIERSKKLESDQLNVDSTNVEKERENFDERSAQKTPSPQKIPLAEQTTPILTYTRSNNDIRTMPIKPEDFWDPTVHFLAAPRQKITLPALNNLTDVSAVRDLIREALEVVVDPCPSDIESLEKYFSQLISGGWIEQSLILLKFLYRKAVEPGDDSKWTPILAKIISDTQEICKKLYHGVLELE